MRPFLILLTGGALLSCSSTKEHHRHEGPPAHDRGFHQGEHGHGHHRFENAEQWASHFEAPERDAWQKPDEVIAALELPHGGRLADIGAATGYFPVRIARARPDVTVYGIDVEPDMVRYLAERAEKEQLSNLQAVQATPSDPNLSQPVDVVLLVNTYHHIEDRPDYLRRLATSLRPGGRVAVVDFRPDSPMGPPHKLPKEQIVEELQQAGYRLASEHDFLPQQYFLVFDLAPSE